MPAPRGTTARPDQMAGHGPETNAGRRHEDPAPRRRPPAPSAPRFSWPVAGAGTPGITDENEVRTQRARVPAPCSAAEGSAHGLRTGQARLVLLWRIRPQVPARAGEEHPRFTEMTEDGDAGGSGGGMSLLCTCKRKASCRDKRGTNGGQMGDNQGTNGYLARKAVVLRSVQ